MSVKLAYTTINGNMEEVEFEKDKKTVSLEFRDIVNVDLTPLKSYPSLQSLALSDNHLQSIDLSPLASIKDLLHLYISRNPLESIDLSPLSSCSNFTLLYLSENILKSVDLSPLSSCLKLEDLRLEGNGLQTIDLEPLRSCESLRYLYLQDNRLHEIDLSPLSSTNLRSLILRNNLLESIDLSPLRSTPLKFGDLVLAQNKLKSVNLSGFGSTGLERVFLAQNELESIDLLPLRSCVKLRRVTLKGNKLESVDITPFYRFKHALVEHDYHCIDYSWVRHPRNRGTYRRPERMYPWSFLYEVVKDFPNDYQVQHDILLALELEDYGFVDSNLTDKFLAIPPETRTEDVQKLLIEILVEEIVDSVDRGGPTTGLNLERLTSKHSEIALRVQRIAELRALEMEKLVVTVNEDHLPIFTGPVDLRYFCLTAYGYEILRTLKKTQNYGTSSLDVEMEILSPIKRALKEIGFTLKTGEGKSGVEMSGKLRKCIWWIKKNDGSNWYSRDLEPIDRPVTELIVRTISNLLDESHRTVDWDELTQVLLGKGVSKDRVDETVAMLIAKRYLDRVFNKLRVTDSF